MKQKVTLTLDRDLLRAARKLALERHTSLSQMIRDMSADSLQPSFTDTNTLVYALAGDDMARR